MDFTDVIDLALGKRHECPYCDSSDGFAVGNDGAKGWMHCFSCRVHGDGIKYLREVEGYDFAEACDALGYNPPDQDIAKAAKRHRKRRQPVELYEPLSDKEKRRVERVLTETDKELILKYAHKALTAETARGALRWRQKHQDVYRQRLTAEMADQRLVDKLDSGYQGNPTSIEE